MAPNVIDRRTSGTTDVVVVGAGPAGAVTALLLARAGFDVALLDRASFPRAKPCGDCLSAGATRILHRLGLLNAVLAERPARLDGWTIVATDGGSFTGRFPPATPASELSAGALSLTRERLDRTFVAAARRAGARLRTGVRVTDLLRDADGRVTGVLGRLEDGALVRLRAGLVVGADGLRSVVARRLGLIRRRPRRHKLSLTAHVRGITEMTDYGELHVGSGIVAGLAPVEQGGRVRSRRADDDPHRLCNATLVVHSGELRRRVAGDAEAFFRRALRSFPALDGRLDALTFSGARDGDGSDGPGRGDRTAEPVLLASGPFDWPTRDVVADGAALVGDAAGYFDPFTGQGIFRALRSAELLAETAAAALRAGSASRRRLRPYARRRARLFRGTRVVQHVIEHFTARPALLDRAARRLDRSPAAADALVSVIGDVASTRLLLSPGLLLTFLVDQFLPGRHPCKR